MIEQQENKLKNDRNEIENKLVKDRKQFADQLEEVKNAMEVIKGFDSRKKEDENNKFIQQ
jgi:hypothetical protein